MRCLNSCTPHYVVAEKGRKKKEPIRTQVTSPIPLLSFSRKYKSTRLDACAYVANHARAQILVVEDDAQLQKILAVRGELQHLKAIVQYSGVPTTKAKEAGVLSWTEFMIKGASVPDYELQWRIAAQAPGNCCTLIYTSGTTGNPKAVMISHDNITWTSTAVTKTLKLVQKDQIVSYLPLSHIAAQMVDIHGPMLCGATVWFAGPDALKGTLVQTFHEVHPTVVLGVPRVWEKMEEKMKAIGAQATGVKRKISTWAKAKGRVGGHAKLEGRCTPFGYGLANALVFKKVRKALGLDRCRIQATAAAPIGTETLEYFLSLNIPILEIYGMSECSGPQTVSVPGKHRIGSTGVSIPGTEIKILPDTGEICFRGRHIFMGYLFQDEKTKEAIDEDGWLHSGDVGEVDAEGFLKITSRIKELLVTAGGENVAPVPIEESLKTQLPIVANVMVIGDRRKFLSMLISLKTEVDPQTALPLNTLTAEVVHVLSALGSTAVTVEEAQACDIVKKHIQEGLTRANEHAISNAAKVQKFFILPTDFSIPGGELGPTMKLRRPIVDQMYAEAISELYKDQEG